MFQTSLTDQVTSYVFNEEQTIVLNSNVVPETYVISFANFQPLSTGKSEVQKLLVKGLIGTRFMLDFGGVTTCIYKLKYYLKFILYSYIFFNLKALLSVGVSAADMQTALNDLPNLSPNLVTVTQSLDSDGYSIIYTVTFSSDLGDVPNILEVLGLVNFTLTEAVTGSPSGNRIQLQIQNSKTNLFTVSNKQSVRINSLI
jgi:hypothetical protein